MSEEAKVISLEEAKEVLQKAALEEQKSMESCRNEINAVLDRYGLVIVPVVNIGIHNGEFGVNYDLAFMRKKKDAVQ